MLAAMNGDVWAANHFTKEAPVLARNLVKAAEHNAWLRGKLEAALIGDGLLVNLIMAFGVGGALLAYAVPPLIYYVNPSFVSDSTREMFGVPKRERKEGPDDAAAKVPAAPVPGAPGGPVAAEPPLSEAA